MRGPGGAVLEVLTAAVVVGAVVTGLALYNADRRDWDELAEFRAAAARESGPSTPYQGRDDTWGRVAIYPVIDDGTLHPVPDGVAGEIWSAFVRIVTPRFAAEQMSALRIADTPQNASAAAVELASVRPQRWILTVNLAANLRRTDYLRTLLHEYAHLLMLDERQLTRTGDCPTTLLPEGCLAPDATLERFQTRFWDRYGQDAPAPDVRSASEAWRLYHEHTGHFVSVYAATNVVEDAAETFVEFVARSRPSPGSGLWAQKIAFYWEQPAYVTIRTHIREWFAAELREPQLPVDDTHR